MAEVVVVGVIRAKEGHEDEVLEGLTTLAEQTHAEEGCLRYAVHRGLDDQRQVVIVERWRSREDLDAHFQQPYVAAVSEQVHLVEGQPLVLFLEEVPSGDPAKGG